MINLNQIFMFVPLIMNEIIEPIRQIQALFDMHQFQRPLFPKIIINIIKKGAKEKKLNTEAIKKTIDQI